MSQQLLFARKDPSVILPTKRDEDAGYDIYAFFKEDEIIIEPHETKMIPTGLYSAFDKNLVGILKERGSSGSKGIAQRCGIIDSGYRGEWFVALTNTNHKTLHITKLSIAKFETVNAIYYPYEKAICQVIFQEVPNTIVGEATIETIQSISSERGNGKIGSSDK